MSSRPLKPLSIARDAVRMVMTAPVLMMPGLIAIFLLSIASLFVKIEPPVDILTPPEDIRPIIALLALRLVFQLYAHGVAIGMALEVSSIGATSIRSLWREAASRLVVLLPLSLFIGLAIVVGLALFILPGILTALLFMFAMPAAVATGLAPMEALSKSASLVRKRAGESFMLFIFLGIVNLLVEFLSIGLIAGLGVIGIGIAVMIVAFIWAAIAVVMLGAYLTIITPVETETPKESPPKNSE